MARVADAKCRLCRREGVLLYLKGSRCFTEKCAVRRRETVPGAGANKMRGRLSEYGTRLREKQKLKRIYGLHERGFRRVYDDALNDSIPAEMLDLLNALDDADADDEDAADGEGDPR